MTSRVTRLIRRRATRVSSRCERAKTGRRRPGDGGRPPSSRRTTSPAAAAARRRVLDAGGKTGATATAAERLLGPARPIAPARQRRRRSFDVRGPTEARRRTTADRRRLDGRRAARRGGAARRRTRATAPGTTPRNHFRSRDRGVETRLSAAAPGRLRHHAAGCCRCC